MAKKESAAAVAPATQAESTATAIATAPGAELASLLDGMDFDVTGLEGVDNDDIKITSLVFNLRGPDPKEPGRMRQVNEWLNTNTEKYSRSVRVAFITFTKTNSYRVFDQTKNKSETICSSRDRVRGQLRVIHPRTNMAPGTDRPCDKCPDMQWRKDGNKNVRDCSTVYNVFACILDEAGNPVEPVIIRFQKTSAPPFKTHLNKWHIGKNPKARGKDLPLFVFGVELTLEADKGGLFAVPAIGEPKVLSPETVGFLKEQLLHWNEVNDSLIAAAEKNLEGFSGDTIDTEGSSAAATTADDFADR